MRIMKFGGKSLGTKEKMQSVAQFVKNAYKKDNQIVVVVSAMGKTTDDLLKQASGYSKDGLPSRELAVLLSTGETMSSALLSMLLNKLGVPAQSFQGFQLQTTTFGDHNNSRIAYINKNIIQNVLDKKIVAVVAGFQGVNANNEITTLGRGGSDTTAAALGAVFEKPVEIYSDFDGVFSGDPRDLDYKKIKHIDFDSIMLMAEGGAKVLDARATELSKKFDIDLTLKSSSQPNKSGTTVSKLECDIISLSVIKWLTKITIVVSNSEKFEKVLKTALLCLNNVKFYNFEANTKKISFFVESVSQNKIVHEISSKLKLVKN